MQEIRERLAQVHATCASRVRNCPSFNIGGGNFDIDFVIRGPGARGARRVRRASCASAPSELGGIVDADTTLKLDKPELRVEIDRERAADLGVDAAGHRHGAAADGRRRRGGLPLPRPAVNEDYDVQLRLERERPQRPGHDRRGSTCRAHGRRPRASSTTSSTLEPATTAVAHRPPRPPAHGQPARRRSPRATRWPTASRRCAQAVDEMNLPAGLHDQRLAAAARELERTFTRVPLGVPALDHLHVHDPGVAVTRAWSTR